MTEKNPPSLCVSCAITGGLGNQLFQIFATLAYGFEHNRKVVFPTNISFQSKNPRHTYWNSFLKNLFIFTTGFKQNQYSDAMFYAFPAYQEKQGFSYAKLPEFKMTNARLYGYFQSYKYFKSYETNIYNLLKIQNIRQSVLDTYKEHYFTSENNMPIISMHFRIGDYKTLPDYHPILSYMYYQHCLDFFVGKFGHDSFRILIFCEKEEMHIPKGYVSHFFQPKYPNIEFMYVEKPMEDWEEMMLMSCTDHHIIANSTYSWWGAYFGKTLDLKTSPDKIVCYPDIWFGYEYMNQNTNDLFPADWTKIDAAMPHFRFTWK
jgi:hypothetical protein